MWNRIQAVLAKKGLNAHQLSVLTGINQSQFSDLKRGKTRSLSWPNMEKIANALDVSLDEFRDYDA